MKYISKFFALFVFASAVAMLAGCGKVSDPVPYEGSGYPHVYPQY